MAFVIKRYARPPGTFNDERTIAACKPGAGEDDVDIDRPTGQPCGQMGRTGGGECRGEIM